MLSPSVLNETHFQYARDKVSVTSQSTLPQLNVANSFISGGSGYGASGFQAAYDTQNQYELQNYTSLTHGTHTLKFGLGCGQIRSVIIPRRISTAITLFKAARA